MARTRDAKGMYLVKYPFGDLNLGDSFIIKMSKTDSDYKKRYEAIRASAYIYSVYSYDVRFSCKALPEGIRVLRIF